MYKLDQAGPKSASTLVNLWIATFEQAYGDVHSAQNIKAYCAANFTAEQASAALSDNKTECAIARKDNQPVGFYLVKHQECPVTLDGGSSELKQIYILAGQYGLGLGKILYADALTSIRSKGRKWVWLCVSDVNYRAQAFYKKQGFKPIGAGPIFEVGSDKLPSTIMARKV